MTATFYLPTAYTDELIDRTYTGDMTAFNAVLAGALAAEGDGVLAADRGPLTAWLGYVFGNPRITRAQAQALLPLGPGDPSPFFLALDSETQQGAILTRADDPHEMASLKVSRRTYKALPRVVFACAAGGDVHDYQCFFEIDDVTAACPFAPDDLTDGQGNPIPQETWQTWGVSGDSHKPVEYGGKWYRENIYGGSYMDASIWWTYVSTPQNGCRVIDVESYAAIVAADSPAP